MRSGLFNSEIIGYDDEGMPIFDRAEEASFFAKYFSNFISNGVFANPSNCLQILAKEKMNLTIKAGSCYINGYLGWLEEDETKELDIAPTLLNRIDRIVARLNLTTRLITIEVLKGVEASTPIARPLTRNADIHELGLADVLVKKSAGAITQSVITDTRLNDKVCGIVHNPLEHLDTHTLYLQIQADLEEFKNVEETDFVKWLDSIKDLLNADVAGNLLDKITKIEDGTTRVKKAEDADTVDGKHASDLQNYKNLTNVPTSFPPSTHNHDYRNLNNIPTSFPPSAHNHGGVGILSPNSTDALGIDLNGTRNGYIESINNLGGTVSNCPQGIKLLATKIQYVNSVVHATVWLYEIYPVSGRIWVNTFNTKWNGWVQVTETHTGVTFMNGWTTNSNAPVITKIGRVVFFNGIFRNGTNKANTVIAKIPQGYIPFAYTIAISTTNAGNGTVVIEPSGNITINSPAPWNDNTQISASWLIV